LGLNLLLLDFVICWCVTDAYDAPHPDDMAHVEE